MRDIVNALGQVINHIDYNSFGKIIAQTNALFGDRFTFTGREWDPTLALYYYRARFYDPHLGRFVSQDPLRFAAGDANLYRYVGNNPLGATDPTGHQVSIGYALRLGAAGAIIGGVLGFLCGFLDGLAEGANPTARALEYSWKGAAAGFAVGAVLGLSAGSSYAGLFSAAFTGIGGTLGVIWVRQSQNITQVVVRAGCTFVAIMAPRLLPGPRPPIKPPPGPGQPPPLMEPPGGPIPQLPAPPNAPGIPRGPGTAPNPPPSAPTPGKLTVPVQGRGTTPAGRPLSPHYEQGAGPSRNIPGSVVDHVIDNYPGVKTPDGKMVHFDPANNVTVVTGRDGIISVHPGPPRPGQIP